MDLDALIQQQKAKLDTVEPVTQDILLGEKLLGVRIWPLQGRAWRDLTAKHPWRAGSVFDENLGFNLDGVVREYPKVYIVDGDDVYPPGDKWAEIVDVLTGPELKAIGYAIWGLNEWDPAERLASAGKASKGKPRKKRSSPAN